MGIPSDPAFISGVDCDYFPPDETPLIVWASFTGILPGDVEPAQGWHCPNGSYRMVQDGGQPCSWTYSVDAQAGFYNIKTPLASCGLTDAWRDAAFSTENEAAGTTYFPNKIAVPALNKYYGGHCQISWLSPASGPSLLQALSDLNIDPSPDVFLEFFPIEAGLMVVKVCRKSDKSNISFKFSY